MDIAKIQKVSPGRRNEQPGQGLGAEYRLVDSKN